MQVSDTEWSSKEKKIAQEAFNKAYKREVDALIKVIRHQASEIVELEDMWRLHDFLSARRHELDGKYDYRYSALIFVFSKLVKDGWLHLDELEGLDKDKLAKISVLLRM
ncbi:MAG: hypothetical protein KME21_16800 [Desmonostoc vinosum HA7617-LM4]|nr:hypothetical protein [Desmonostoc vinosum HA7617-LM4]